jgi:hypothetical protein
MPAVVSRGLMEDTPSPEEECLWEEYLWEEYL